jgi:2-polyprenyl-3-methyl-5-hydroxy-6-metoxy-1,4-benzoquinol methylase
MIPPDGRIIGSIGCWRGAVEAELVGQGRLVHGVDVNAEAIAIARSRLTSARVVEPDRLDHFELDSLDGLILADVIEHLPMAWNALRVFATFVKPGGWVVISVPNMRSLSVMYQWLARGDWPERRDGVFDSTHLQMMSRRRLTRWCQQAGLKLECWFDRYLYADSSRERWIGRLDRLSLRCLNGWLQHQLQGRWRRVGLSD